MVTNRAKVGNALELARNGLRPFVERCLRRALRGREQVSELLQGTDYAENEDPLADIAAIVRLMLSSRLWYEVFQNELRRPIRAEVRSLVGEVGSIRNRWAHQEEFSDDDTERALDTIQRLLRDINGNQAEAAAKLLEQHRAASVASVVPATDAPSPPTPPPPSLSQPDTPADNATSPSPDTPPARSDYQAAAEREIERLRGQIAAKHAEREGLDVRRNYLEEDLMRIAQEFEENKRRIADEIDGVGKEALEAATEIEELEHASSVYRHPSHPLPQGHQRH